MEADLEQRRVVEARFSRVSARRLGLRGSQVERYGVPEASMQPLTDRDRKRAENLLVHPWVAERRPVPPRRAPTRLS